MGILPLGKTARRLEALAEENASLSTRLAEVEGFVIDDIDRGTTGTSRYSGNSYSKYADIIKELASKYQGQSKWGNVQAGNIVDTRAAFIIGQGLAVSPVGLDGKNADPESKEMKFAKEFLEYNDLDREMAQEYAKEGEIEGCFLGVLAWIPGDEQVSLSFMSRVETKYTVIHPKNDYSWYQKIEWKEGSEPKSLEEPLFVYARFGGRVHKPNEPTPKVGKCLTEIEGLAQALRDWREINRLFGAPVPHIQCTTAEEAKAMKDAIKDVANNWRARKLFAHTGTLLYLTPAGEAQAGIEREIITRAKMISGATGCPIAFMGFGDLTTKLGSGSEVTSDQVESSTSKERLIWVGTYQQILQKAMALRNENSKTTPLRPELVKVSIPRVSPETWARLTNVWIPLLTAGAVSTQTVLEQIPNVDPAKEMERIAAEKDANMERFEKMHPDEGEEDEDEEEEE